MPLFDCPACGAGLRLPAGGAGRRVRCGGCGQAVRVPADPPAPPAQPGRDEPPAVNRRGSRLVLYGLAVLLGTALMVIGGVIAVLLDLPAGRKPAAQPVAAASPVALPTQPVAPAPSHCPPCSPSQKPP
jgi:hypothetical protein